MIDVKDVSLTIKNTGCINGTFPRLTLTMKHVPSGKTITVDNVGVPDEFNTRKEMLETLDLMVNKDKDDG